MKIPAIVFDKKCSAVLQEAPLTAPALREVQIRTEVSYISTGTERWCLRGDFSWAGEKFPCIPGYQRVGVITALGGEVENFYIGQRVMATTCPWTDSGLFSMWGAHAAAGNTPVNEVYSIPPGLASLDASAAVIAQVGYNAASRLSLVPGSWVLACGDGLISQFAAQSARALGARTILVGRHEDRLSLARSFGADFTINTRNESLLDRVKQITEGTGLSAVLDSLQSEALQAEYIPLLNKTGPYPPQIVYCGFSPEKTWADMALLQQEEITCHFVSGWNRSRMEKTIQMMTEGLIRPASLVTHLHEYTRGAELYRIMLEKSSPFLGMAIQWNS